MSSVKFTGVIQRVRVHTSTGRYRIRTGGSGPPGSSGLPGGITSSNGTVLDEIVVTQAEYDALSPPDPFTVYHIRD